VRPDRRAGDGASTAVVAVDCYGADLGPAEVAAGAALAAQRGVRTMLFGPLAELRDAVADAPAGMVEVVDAPLSIAKVADPVRAARTNADASIVQAARAVASGRAQALVCAGSTGVALAAGTFNIRRARGIYRPALAITLPVPGHPVTLLDVGANAQARGEHLVQFAFMGSALAEAVLRIERPRVGLLSNGQEAGRGSAAVLEAHAQLDRHGAGETGSLRFVGNVEGGDVVAGAVDVVVTDGFTGNVALKLMEGVSATILGAVRDAALASPRGRLGGALLRGALGEFRRELDPERHGGAYLLGLRRLGVVPHGRFARAGFAQAVMRADFGAREDIVGRTHHALERAGALRRAPASAALASVPQAQ
jgi:phosphate acyltransferase